MTSATLVRAAKLHDVAALQSLLGDLGYDIQTEALEEQVRSYHQSNASHLLVAEGIDGTLVGLISGHAIPLLHRPGKFARITALVVSETARYAGIGRKLVSELEGWFAAQGCVRYEVTSGASSRLRPRTNRNMTRFRLRRFQGPAKRLIGVRLRRL